MKGTNALEMDKWVRFLSWDSSELTLLSPKSIGHFWVVLGSPVALDSAVCSSLTSSSSGSHETLSVSPFKPPPLPSPVQNSQDPPVHLPGPLFSPHLYTGFSLPFVC